MSTDFLRAIPVPVPTIDRPFGVEVWPFFDKLYTAINGYHPEDFKFTPGVAAMSTLKETAIMITTYYIVIFAGRELMRNRPAMKLNGLFMVHNLYLTIISGGLLALFIEQLLPTVWRHGIFYGICNVEGGWTKQLVILYYVCPHNSIFTTRH
jgi:fatty acid elongase 2/fatty acid elongase 3